MTAKQEIQKIANDIESRSRDLRKSYLGKINQQKIDSSKAKSNMGCSNFAHAFAACDKGQQSQAADGAPVIGIVNAYNDMLSAHEPLKDYPDIIKETAIKNNSIARVAAGVPAMCDGITQGEPGMELSLFSRDVIAMSTAVGFSHNVFDAGLCLGVCDKIVPGLVIGALSFGHLPIGFIPAGPMSTGLSNKEKAENRKKFTAGEIDRSALIASEQASYHSSGTCTFYGTANTNQLIIETMGLQLPSASFTPPGTNTRKLLIEKTVTSVLDLNKKDSSLGEMLDVKSWVNGLVALLGSGGSTNLTIHMLAMARAGGFHITLDDINALSNIVPTIASVYPNGSADVNEFHNAGGVASLIGSLLDGGYLFDDVSTILGSGLEKYANKLEVKDNNLYWENRSVIKDQSIIRDTNNPFRSSGGIKVIDGNIGRGIIKVSALEDSEKKITAPAKVFQSQEEVIQAFENDELNADTILVVKGQGPSANGMPELHKLTSIVGVLRARGHEIALVTDGRMSGASGSFPAIIHIHPEAAKGGNIGKIRDNDSLTINLATGNLDIDLSEDELNLRSVELNPISQEGVGRELFNIFRNSVTDVDDGASVFD